MGTEKMSLLEVVRNLETFDEEATIYAAEPWTKESLSVVLREPDSGGIPTAAAEANLRYFLEVFVAQEFLEGWPTTTEADLERKCERLIKYAITDA